MKESENHLAFFGKIGYNMKSLLGENEQHKGYAIQILHKMGDVVMKLAAKTTEELRQLHQEAAVVQKGDGHPLNFTAVP